MYDLDMIASSAVVSVLDFQPTEEDITEAIVDVLDELEEDDASATAEVLTTAPDWMDISEQDQINSHLRDGGVCVLVVYISLDEDNED